ncbi:hypothetical protein OROGR_014209 [Orobanche gracilis]
MIPEPELEEGESHYYKDDTRVDPDIALSYIGDKVQSILGHFQKDFEGGVSAENLGAKFGGYGSFLPTHQCSPSIWLQPKSPHNVHNSHSSRSPNACPGVYMGTIIYFWFICVFGHLFISMGYVIMQGPAPSPVMVSDLPSTQRDVSQALKTSFDDASNRQKINLTCDKVAEVLPPSNKSVNPPDRRTLKVRIKVGPERVAQYNAEIYNLGLTSPSSSEGNSHDESDELLIESHETPNESPAKILKVMTSFPVCGGLLLSPLCEDLLNLARKTENSVESKHEPATKNPATSVRLLDSNGKKTKTVHKSGEIDKPEDEVTANQNDCKQKTLGVENIECSVQPLHQLNPPLPDPVRETEKDVQVKRTKGSKDRVKERAVSDELVKDTFLVQYAQPESRCSSIEKIVENRARISQKDVSVDHMQGSKNRVKVNHASMKAYSDHSEGEGVKRTTDNSILKVSPYATSSAKHNVSGIPHAVNRLSFNGEKRAQGSQNSGKLLASKADGLRNGDCAAQEDKYSGKKGTSHRLHLSKKGTVYTDLKNVEDSKRENINLDVVKAKSGSADKLKKRVITKKCSDRLSYDTLIAEPPAAAVHSAEGTVDGLKQVETPSIIIEENWVACDRCEKWRLLPPGTKSEDLPDKWVCSMLDWLPGMNHCDVSEDDTTKALQASYPENQHDYQAHTDGTISGVISSDTLHFNQNRKMCASDQMKKQKLKEKISAVSTMDLVLSNGKMQLQRPTAGTGSSKVMKQSFSGVNVSNKPDMQHPNKSTVVSGKSNKRKGEHVVGDEASMRKKIKIESSQKVNGKVEKIKSKDDMLTADSFRTSSGALGGMYGHISTCAFPNKADMKDAKKMSIQRNEISGGDFRISVKKKHRDQMQLDLPDNGPSGLKSCNGGEIAAKKIKLKTNEYSPQIKESNIKDRTVHIKEESRDVDFHRDAKSRVSQGDTSKRKSDEARFQLSGGQEYLINRSNEKERQVKKPKPKVQLTIEDIDKLRQDLGCEQPSTAATSSSSKVSGSHKNRISYMKVKGSPEESVCSSPVRVPYQKHVSSMVDTIEKVDSKGIRDVNESSERTVIARKGISGLTNDNVSEILETRNKLKEETGFDNHDMQKHEVSSNMRHSPANGPSVRIIKKGTSVSKKDFEKLGDINGAKSTRDSPKRTVEQISAKMEPRSGKLHIDLRQGDKQGAFGVKKQVSGLSRSVKRCLMDLRPLDASVADNTSRDLKDTAKACLQNVTGNIVNNEKQSVALEESLGKKNAISASTFLKEAELALREAEELRVHADLIKNSGFSSESNYEYFKAALKFLHGASLLETSNGESNKHLEMSPMQMYSTAAQLCKTCASEYEKSHEIAAAALAYKCMEVAYLRVVYCKSSNTSRIWHDLQSSLKMDRQGESPSSSASDIDNLNNLVMLDKATLSKGGCSHPGPGSQVMVPRNCGNFVRLLDFTKDVNAAMGAAKKSQDTFAAAHVELAQSQNKEAISCVKRVIDFSFQDVEELVRLVSLAFNTINHYGLRLIGQ